MSRAAALALRHQWRLTGGVVSSLIDADLERPTRLPGWRVAELVVHLVETVETVATNRGPQKPFDVLGWYDDSQLHAERIDSGVRARARRSSAADLSTAYFSAVDEAEAVLGSNAKRPKSGGVDPLSLYCITRCLEAVTHTLDLCEAIVRPPVLDDVSLELSVDYLVEVLHRAGIPEPLAFDIEGSRPSQAGSRSATTLTLTVSAIQFVEACTGRRDAPTLRGLRDVLPIVQ